MSRQKSGAQDSSQQSTAPKGKVTLKSLASSLNLSVTTVSRALAGYNDVSQKTQALVRQAAAEQGYTPNQNARRLVTGKTDAIGVLLPMPYGDMRDHFLSYFLLSFGKALHEHNPNLDLIISYAPEGDEELATYRRFIEGNRVDAFILLRTRRHDPRVDLLLEHKIPFVSYGRTNRQHEHNWVDADANTAFAMATEHLLQQGHTNIVLLNLPTRIYTAQLREEGYMRAMQAAGLEPQAVTTELINDQIVQCVEGLLQSATPPSAFLCASDIIASTVVTLVQARGLQPGKDIAIIGCDNLPISQHSTPSITTLETSFDEISREFVRLLNRQLNGLAAKPDHTLVDFKLIERDTTAR